MRLVHFGDYKAFEAADMPGSHVAEAKPHTPQVLKFNCKSPRSIANAEKTHTNYKPGFIYELGRDQCRFVINDENHTFCGAKQADGKSYCPDHQARCSLGRVQSKSINPKPMRLANFTGRSK